MLAQSPAQVPVKYVSVGAYLQYSTVVHMASSLIQMPVPNCVTRPSLYRGCNE